MIDSIWTHSQFCVSFHLFITLIKTIFTWPHILNGLFYDCAKFYLFKTKSSIMVIFLPIALRHDKKGLKALTSQFIDGEHEGRPSPAKHVIE